MGTTSVSTRKLLFPYSGCKFASYDDKRFIHFRFMIWGLRSGLFFLFDVVNHFSFH